MIFVVNKKLKKKKIRCIKTKLVTKKTKNILSYKAIVVVSAVKLDVYNVPYFFVHYKSE